MAKRSAGILLYRTRNSVLEFLLVHPGGPLWAKKDDGAWSIPKGEFENEDSLVAARREFHEETGVEVSGSFISLSPVKSKSGKILYPFGLEHDFDTKTLKSNLFKMEWPPRSGAQRSFPEVDRAEWFGYEVAKVKLSEYQVAIVEELLKKLKTNL
jgi:predicted NUDIX family NTP pyrophosphohydrolase